MDRIYLKVGAERVGFEPTVPFRGHSLSRRARSATLAPLRGGATLPRESGGYNARPYAPRLPGSPADRGLLLPAQDVRPGRDRDLAPAARRPLSRLRRDERAEQRDARRSPGG